MNNNFLNEDDREIAEIEKNEEYDHTKELERLDITYYSIERSIAQLLKWKREGKLIIPDFQRDFVWDFEKACSLMVNLPIPNIFVFREIDDKKREMFRLIDGRQRIETFEMYVNEKFKSANKEIIFNLPSINNSQWANKTYSQLDEVDKDAFNDYPINITVFESVENIGDIKKKNAIIEIFKRVNSGADPLTVQEIRNAICSGPALQYVKEYLSSPKNNFSLLTLKDRKIILRFKQDEIIFRILAYKNIYDCLIAGDKSANKYNRADTITEYIDWANNHFDEFKKNFNEFDKTLNCIVTLSKDAVYNVKRNYNGIGKRVHEVFFEAMVITISLLKNTIKINYEEFLIKKINIWKDPNLKSCFVSSTVSDDNIKKRVQILKRIINNE